MIRVQATTDLAATTAADTVAIGLLDGERLHHDTADGALAALVEAGEARATPRHLAQTHADGKRWLLVGLGERDELDDEVLRAAAATVHARARELGTKVLCWELPHKLGDELHPARAVVEGTLLAAHRLDRWKRRDEDDAPRGVEQLIVSDHDDRTAAVARAVVVAEAVNACRRLQESPANEATPEALAARARELHPAVRVEVEGRDGIEARGMGAFAAVAQGTRREPQLITLRYEPDGATGPVLGLVGKAVTFDTGGISLKPGAKMAEMKFDMSGGAAVLEAIGAIARLGLPVRVVGVVGATENMPGGQAMRPGDIVRSAEGLTIEVDNTDAEGRLVLADCLFHARQEGAERLVDVATLTGAIVVALGSTYTGMVASDDAWAGEVLAATADAGEPTWRLPLHPEYARAVRGKYADLTNSPEARKAGSITAGEFLKRFTGDVPWAHLDIAGTAWDGGRPYAPKGGTGVMVRSLVALAERVAAGA
ncbi:leucyl aminopeptidase [Conexibacter sp. SYSU D00693]|uniref:leucyl aminopeptidase n=1 Tax=Conexibacter sp. SYSU D00693 TaxID=2812560 RepID=UPI00196A3B67|nr:leucyl aminopeptidase [Conexibacter sp. SYSU D00693]